MTIYSDKAKPFNCVICDRSGPSIWDNPNRMTIAPLCYRCERENGGGGGMDDDAASRAVNSILAKIGGAL